MEKSINKLYKDGIQMSNKLQAAWLLFSFKCGDKLEKKEKQGWAGWNNPENEPNLKFKLLQHFEKEWTQENLVDISNFCLFLWNLKEEERKNAKNKL